MNYSKKHKEITKKSKKRKKKQKDKDFKKQKSNENNINESKSTDSEEESDDNIWKKPLEINKEKSREEEFEEYLDDLFL